VIVVTESFHFLENIIRAAEGYGLCFHGQRRLC
jgi:hypothetical protein